MFKYSVYKKDLEGTTVYTGFINFFGNTYGERKLIWQERTRINRLTPEDAKQDCLDLINQHATD